MPNISFFDQKKQIATIHYERFNGVPEHDVTLTREQVMQSLEKEAAELCTALASTMSRFSNERIQMRDLAELRRELSAHRPRILLLNQALSYIDRGKPLDWTFDASP